MYIRQVFSKYLTTTLEMVEYEEFSMRPGSPTFCGKGSFKNF